MERRDSLKGIIDFFRDNKRLSALLECIPNIKKYRNKVTDEWPDLHVSGETQVALNCTWSEAKKIIPLKSLRVVHDLSSIKRVYVDFNTEEFNKVMLNKTNKLVLSFVREYKKLSITDRFRFYLDNKETIRVLIDSLETKYYLINTEDILTILEFLLDEIGMNEHGIYISNIEERVTFEVEFIKKRRESEQYI